MLTVEELRFAYRRGDELFMGLSHSFESRTVTAVTGQSGRGKSTLLYIVGLLLTPTSGQVIIGGRPVAQLSDGERSGLRARSLGFVFQDSSLDETRTVLDNVIEGAVYAGTPRARAVERAANLLTRFDVNLRADHRPGQVSGGQAQRIALCRALLNRPDIVLADEPTGNLDPTARDHVIHSLREVASEGATVIIATHDPQIVARCDGELAL